MGKKVVWFSRHNIIPKQRAELEQIFGKDIEILIDTKPFSNADDVVGRFNAVGADEMVIVAPLSVIDAITKWGVKPLYAEMQAVKNGEDYDVIASGRKYRFDRFVRIKSVIIEKEELSEQS